MPNPDIELEIYKQNCEDLRFYGDMRFKQLTLWSVGMGFVLNLLSGKESTILTLHQKELWYLAAFFWTSVIWVMEVRSSVHGVRRMRVKGRQEGEVDPEVVNKWTLFNATNVVALLYAASSLACVVQLERMRGPCAITFWGPTAVLLLLMAFTFREYWPLLKHAVANGRL